MPITRKYHLKDLMEACAAYPLRPWEKLTFEYVLLRGVNDTDADARRVVKLLANLNCKVNLIALNPGPGIPFETPMPERVAGFQAIVRRSMPCFRAQAARAGYLRGLRAVEPRGRSATAVALFGSAVWRTLKGGERIMATATLDWSQCPAVESVPPRLAVYGCFGIPDCPLRP